MKTTVLKQNILVEVIKYWFWLNLALLVSCQDDVSFSCSLSATGQAYVCPEESVTYVCSGPGDMIELNSSPNVSVLFERGNVIGTRLSADPFLAYLISTDFPMMMAGVVVVNSSFDQIIGCRVPPAQVIEVGHRMSGIYMPCSK